METGLLHLHNVLRWVILLFLLLALFQAITKRNGIRSSSLFLMICAHLMLLIGIYQLINGRFGILKGLTEGVELMKNTFYRFYWVEHPLLMFLAIVFITIARGKAKVLNYKAAGWLLFIALLLILAAMPWPFRDIIGDGRKWFPGM
jgi:disulfide bond formation protein DsbB